MRWWESGNEFHSVIVLAAKDFWNWVEAQRGILSLCLIVDPLTGLSHRTRSSWFIGTATCSFRILYRKVNRLMLLRSSKGSRWSCWCSRAVMLVPRSWTQGRLSPLRPWSKIPLLLAVLLPYFPLPLPLSCPFFPPFFRSRKPLNLPIPSISIPRRCKQGSGGFSLGENFSNLDGCRWNLMHFWAKYDHSKDGVCLKSEIHEIHEIQSLSRNPLSD